MPTFVYSHPDIFLHDMAAEHCAMAPDRIARIYGQVSQVPGIDLKLADECSIAQLARNHSLDFIEQLQQGAPSTPGQLYRIDSETVLNQHTWRTLMLSAGAACQAVEAVQEGIASNAFCVTYAGHHATQESAGGFCFFNPVAVAAYHALATGSERVAILDMDTHSGNGTILSVMREPRILFAETYQAGYPGSFLPGFCPANVHRKRCNTPQDFLHAWKRLLLSVSEFQPDLILVSAGFDAHRNDPLGTIGLSDNHYAWLAREILAVNPKVVACLEGGYAVETAGRCAALFVAEMVRITSAGGQ